MLAVRIQSADAARTIFYLYESNLRRWQISRRDAGANRLRSLCGRCAFAEFFLDFSMALGDCDRNWFSRGRTSPLRRPSLIIGSKLAVNFIVVSGQQNAVVSPRTKILRRSKNWILIGGARLSR